MRRASARGLKRANSGAPNISQKVARAPRAVGLAGVLFAVLLGVIDVLPCRVVPARPRTAGARAVNTSMHARYLRALGASDSGAPESIVLQTTLPPARQLPVSGIYPVRAGLPPIAAVFRSTLSPDGRGMRYASGVTSQSVSVIT